MFVCYCTGAAFESSGSFGSDDDGSPDNNKHFAGYQLKASISDEHGAGHQDNSREQRTWPAENAACPTQHVPVPKLPSPPRHQTLTGISETIIFRTARCHGGCYDDKCLRASRR